MRGSLKPSTLVIGMGEKSGKRPDGALTPEILAIEEKREALAEIERGHQAVERRKQQPGAARSRRYSAASALALALCTGFVGALIGAWVFYSTTEQDPQSFVDDKQVSAWLGGALGAGAGAILGLLVWWRWRRQPPPE